MNRHTRYQGAIVRNHSILLIKQRVFPIGRIVWLFPGGNIEPGETEEECVRREMKEETSLDVRVVSLLLDGSPQSGDRTTYYRMKTYLCEPTTGEASPGIEPEYDPKVKAAGPPDIVEVRWFDLRSEATWDPVLVNDPIIYLPLQQVRKKLGYLP
jgi:8-oxo-dGTP pyrophosphatase MutT (NUDIX family)